MRYEWDPDKARSNVEKHGVDFADAVGTLEDPLALTIEDTSTAGEERFVTVGLDRLGRVLVVVYTWRDTAIRLISARRATRSERRDYQEIEPDA